MRRAAAFALGALVLAGCASTRPAAPDAAPAVVAVQAYMAATTAQDWSGVAERIDPDDLAKLQPIFQMMGDEVGPVPDDPVSAFALLLETMVGEVSMMGDMFPSVRGEILGAVAETDSLVHVVLRSSADMMGTLIYQVSAVTVRQDADGRWLVRLDGKVDALSSILESVVGPGGVPAEVGPMAPASEQESDFGTDG